MKYALDYSSLLLPVTKSDIAAYDQWSKVNKPRGSARAGLGLIALVFGSPLLLLIPQMLKAHKGWTVVYVAVLALLGYLIVHFSKRVQKDKVRLYRFARANNLNVRFDLPVKKLSGTLFQAGGGPHRLHSRLTLPDASWVGNYSYFVQTNNGQRETRWKVACMTLPRRLPHIVLDAQINNILTSNLPTAFGGQMLQLEGNFSDAFRVYVPKGYERDALYLLTPDVMATIIDHGRGYDIEIIGSKLYLYGNGFMSFENSYDIADITKSISAIYDDLSKQAKNYSDANTGDYSVDLIAEQGGALQERMNIRDAKRVGLLVLGVFVVTLVLCILLFTVTSTVNQ